MPVALTLALCSLLPARHADAEETTSCVAGEAEIRARAGKSEIVIRTTSRLAGAIDSLTWDGMEFIDSFDHGRQLQSASNLYSGTPYHGETFNPTEAGSRSNGAGPTSTSRLLHLTADGNELQTTTQMAFWLRPGEKSGGHPARNTSPLSNHLLTKRVRIGIEGLPHVIQYDATFSLPVGERHTMAQFEAVTGYMPARFSRFLAFESSTGKLVPLSDGPGEQSRPVVLSTPDGKYAMGVYSPQQPSPGWKNAGYGRFRFSPQKVVKWNCVFRIRDRERGIEPGDYSFRSYVIVGDLETVRQSLVTLHERFDEGT